MRASHVKGQSRETLETKEGSPREVSHARVYFRISRVSFK